MVNIRGVLLPSKDFLLSGDALSLRAAFGCV
jgi:hypothetical protein